jgi:hypothetical protein
LENWPTRTTKLNASAIVDLEERVTDYAYDIVNEIELTPGPSGAKGDTGASGAKGDTGATGETPDLDELFAIFVAQMNGVI